MYAASLPDLDRLFNAGLEGNARPENSNPRRDRLQPEHVKEESGGGYAHESLQW